MLRETKARAARPPEISRVSTHKAGAAKAGKASRAERALEQIPPEFRERCSHLRMLLAKLGPANTRVRYKMGVLVKEAEDAVGKYGKGLVAQFARALGFDEKTLYRYAKFAKTWTERELDDLLTRIGTTGRPIDFTHLVEIARVSTKKGRSALIDAVLQKGLSQRELKKCVEQPVRPVEEAEQGEDLVEEVDPEPKESGPAPIATSAGAVRSLRATLKTWRQSAEHLERDLLTLFVAPVPAELVPQLKDIIAEEQALEGFLEHLRGRLRSLIE